MNAQVKDGRTLRVLAIVGLVMVLAGSLYFAYRISQPCMGNVNPGCPIPDILTVDSSRITSSTSMTLQLRDSGQHSVSLSSYYITDPTSHTYSSPAGWTGPTIHPNMPTNMTFTIDGKDFTFQSNSSYNVSVSTSGDTFHFTVST